MQTHKPRKGLLDGFLTFFGDLKVFKWPLFIVYDPSGYRIKGEDIRELLQNLQPGDILVRKFDKYLDGWFIPGYFSHVALYLGRVTEQEVRSHVDESYMARDRGDGRPVACSGEQMVIHAVAEGVELQDLLTFCRCDYLAVMRLPPVIQAQGSGVPAAVVEKWHEEEKRLHQHLCDGGHVLSAEAVECIRAVALRQLGKPYDFKFDFGRRRVNRLSCCELAHVALRCLEPFHQIRPMWERVFLLFRRSFIRPDAFVGFDTGFEHVWKTGWIPEDRFARARRGARGWAFDQGPSRPA